MTLARRRGFLNASGALLAGSVAGELVARCSFLSPGTTHVLPLSTPLLYHVNDGLAWFLLNVRKRSVGRRDLVGASQKVQLLGRHLIETNFDDAFRTAAFAGNLEALHYFGAGRFDNTVHFLRHYDSSISEDEFFPQWRDREVTVTTLFDRLIAQGLSSVFQGSAYTLAQLARSWDQVVLRRARRHSYRALVAGQIIKGAAGCFDRSGSDLQTSSDILSHLLCRLDECHLDL